MELPGGRNRQDHISLLLWVFFAVATIVVHRNAWIKFRNDAIMIQPSAGDGMYSVGHVRLLVRAVR